MMLFSLQREKEKANLERVRYAFLDHSKTLVFSDAIKKNSDYFYILAPFVPVPCAPNKTYRATLTEPIFSSEYTFYTCHGIQSNKNEKKKTTKKRNPDDIQREHCLKLTFELALFLSDTGA